MTIVRPPVRFGEVKTKGLLIMNFKEKPQIKQSWINGGFFVFNKIFLNFWDLETKCLKKHQLKTLKKKRTSRF